MKNAILMSIKPQYCEKILSGEKKIELRRTIPKLKTPFVIYVYECGTGKIPFMFYCSQIQEIKTSHIIDSVIAQMACVSKSEYDKYNPNYYLSIHNPEQFKTTLTLSDFGLKRPPQSWQYVEEING